MWMVEHCSFAESRQIETVGEMIEIAHLLMMIAMVIRAQPYCSD